jgi:hypothetical protein
MTVDVVRSRVYREKSDDEKVDETKLTEQHFVTLASENSVPVGIETYTDHRDISACR